MLKDKGELKKEVREKRTKRKLAGQMLNMNILTLVQSQ